MPEVTATAHGDRPGRPEIGVTPWLDRGRGMHTRQDPDHCVAQTSRHRGRLAAAVHRALPLGTNVRACVCNDFVISLRAVLCVEMRGVHDPTRACYAWSARPDGIAM
ncbi:hypothetical protein MRX96_031673 [Rhipicephalus microplus]